MEAQREITQNQNLIFKPDSVLHYTCFDKHLNLLAKYSATMFSGSPRWGNLGTATNMTASLNNLLGVALNTYLAADLSKVELGNFNHSYLGGRLSGQYNAPIGIAPGDYECNVMNAVWQQAKCMDFMSDSEHDGFFTFDEYVNKDDMRFLPTQCKKPVSPGGEDAWAENKKIALDEVLWTRDTISNYLKLLDADNCVSSKGIKTGITVVTSGFPKGYEEAVCIKSGCHYKPTGKSSGQCVPNS